MGFPPLGITHVTFVKTGIMCVLRNKALVNEDVQLQRTLQ